MSYLRKIVEFIALPAQMSDFERRYLARVNRIALAFFVLHLPIFVLLALLNDTGPLTAALLTLGALVGPALASSAVDNPRSVSVIHGITAMLMGGILVHVGQGPVQIEMHFYFFALIAMLAVFANPLVIVVAAVTVAAHHLLVWLIAPASVFNYDAPFWVVIVHAAFVILESVATCFIARSFFENVIGLEKVVQARTRELDDRNADMRLVLDNVEQGFMTIDAEGVLSCEYSAVVERWLGKPEPGDTLEAFVRRSAPAFADDLALAWTEVIEDVMPLELTLHQLPRRLTLGALHLRLSYIPIMAGTALAKLLVVITNETIAIEREKLEAEQRETLVIFDRVMHDKAGLLEFFEEADAHVKKLEQGRFATLTELKRSLHTLKGNCMIYGIQTVAEVCHEMETAIDEAQAPPPAFLSSTLFGRWARLKQSLNTLCGGRGRSQIEIGHAEYRSLLGALESDAPRGKLIRMISDWRLESTGARLTRLAEQTRAIARRLNRPSVEIEIDHAGLRLDPRRWAPFWASFVHVVRNAVDHGLESPEERADSGKPGAGTIALRTRLEHDRFVVEIEDDGRGIDWDAVARSAVARGLPHQSEADLVQALFRDGVTTRIDVSELSGRGVGMGAVREACRSLSGDVIIESRPGRGTRVAFSFPESAMNSLDEASAAA